MRGSSFPFVCMVLSALIFAGCGPKRAQYDDLYARLAEETTALDWRVLEGRRIVIDPGHGGCFGGVVGLDSLREADANLGVALYLWGLLKEAGADVHLTRTTDRDFTAGDSTDLRADLERRTAAANALGPEVFISIHHNSNLPIDRERNSVEIYYRSEDPGASLELANDIHTHLARNLGIEISEIEPASYYVLRNSTAQAAVLGEASYLSNPGVEDKLKLSAKQKLEGEAYFLGLLSYFSRGIPVIERLSPVRDTLQAPGSIAFRISPGASAPIDPGSAAIRVGKSAYEPLYDARTSVLHCALDPLLPNGPYEVVCTARSVGGGTASSKPFTLFVSRPARFVLPLPPLAEPEDRLSLGVRVLDENGAPVADGTMISIRSLDGAGTFTGVCRKGVFRFDVDRAIAPSPYIAALSGLIDTLRFAVPSDEYRLPLLVLDAVTGKPVSFPQAAPLEIPACGTARGDSRGLIMLTIPPDSISMETKTTKRIACEWIVSTPGYRPKVLRYVREADAGHFENVGQTISLEPLFGGVLHGMRIAIDPAGGGGDHGGLGKNKLRGATVNLEIAQRLGELLRRGGADVMSTRTGEESISLEERIYKINRFRPDVAIRLGSARAGEKDDGECIVLHYPGSEGGRALAESLSFKLEDLPPCAGRSVAESANRFLQQTSCPAVEVRGESISRVDAERIFAKAAYAQLEAERIMAAIIAYSSKGTIDPPGQTVRIVRDGEPVSGAAVSVDLAMTRFTDASGIARFACIEQGEHLLTVQLPPRYSVPPKLAPLTVTDGSLQTFSFAR
jgi:N-acetylmuramoyl-L-alanine amidase